MQFNWPTTNHTLGDLFGARNGEHQGIDLAVPNHTPVFSAAPGIISFIGQMGGYGNLIIIDHAEGYQTRYGHLSAFLIPVGKSVPANWTIALSGGIAGAPGSGDSTGPHLHFEIRHNGTPINPLPLLKSTTTTDNTATEIGNFLMALTDQQQLEIHEWLRQLAYGGIQDGVRNIQAGKILFPGATYDAFTALANQNHTIINLLTEINHKL